MANDPIAPVYKSLQIYKRPTTVEWDILMLAYEYPDSSQRQLIIRLG